MNNQNQIRVWDAFIRLFHWALVGLFVVEFVIDDDFIDLHSLFGYLIFCLLVFRILYGFIGTQYARFNNFLYKPSDIIHYVKSVFSFNARRYIGHNPAGGAMIILMIIALLLAAISGVLALDHAARSGPLLSFTNDLPYWVFVSAQETHELLAYFCLLLVIVHIAGVLIESILHEENLIRSMITGRKNE